MVAPPEIEDVAPEGLQQLIALLRAENAELKRANAELREEIARLKGLKGRPQIKPNKPSGMDRGTAGRPRDKRPGASGRGKVNPRVKVEDQIIRADVPAGSSFKGYEDFVVQDVVLQPRTIRYRRERWLTPDQRTVVAPLPAGVRRHFGPELRRLLLMLYHQGQMTVPRLVQWLREIGISISKRQVVRLLLEDQEEFHGEARDVLCAGLQTASWVSVDDTGARHKARNEFCTQIGNDDFTWFGTTPSKSRLNFLELLRAGHTDYVINDAALSYMRDRDLSGPVITRLAASPNKRFADPELWQAHLERLDITELKVTPDPVRVATEGAVWGSVQSHGFRRDMVILSDDAGQFAVGEHALCWIHAERLVHKLDTFTDDQRTAQQQVRSLIWQFYADLKDYRRTPSPLRRASLTERFDYIFCRRTGFVTLDRLLQRLHANKAELLAVLEHPDIPLHTNGSENDIRSQVIRRKISGGTRSDLGRDCRDAFLGLAKTCAKLGISFWNFLGSRCTVPDQPTVPALPDLIRARAQPA
jgi:Transposase IS66 family